MGAPVNIRPIVWLSIPVLFIAAVQVVAFVLTIAVSVKRYERQLQIKSKNEISSL
jgi:hypothetical protein